MRKYDGTEFKLKYSGVKKYLYQPHSDEMITYPIEWGYDEFELNENKSWTQRIFLPFEGEMEIVFGTISIRRVTNKP